LEKRYSRNLGTGDGIELTCPVLADFDGDGHVNFRDLTAMSGQWLNFSDGLSADISQPAGDGLVDMQDFARFARYWSAK